MTVREYLGGYLRKIREVDRLNDQICQLRTRMTRMTAAYGEHVGGHGTNGGFAERIPELCDLLSELSVQMNEAAKEAQNIRAVIARVESPLLREALELRYLLGETWESAAEKMNRSVRWYADEIKIAEKEIEPYVQDQLQAKIHAASEL